jgi:hypothetical protein
MTGEAIHIFARLGGAIVLAAALLLAVAMHAGVPVP